MEFFRILNVLFLFLGVGVAIIDANSKTHPEIIKEGNAVIKIQQRARKIKEYFDSLDLKEVVHQELTETIVHGDVTELQMIQTVLQEKEKIFSQADGKVFGECLADSTQYLADLINGSTYAWQMRTSAVGRPEIGLPAFTWSFEYMGIYELCESVNEDNPDAPFETIYCTENIPVADGWYYKRDFCAPASCSNDDLLLVRSLLYSQLDLQLPAGSYYTCIRYIPWDWDAIFVTCLLGFFLLLVAIGTLYDIITRPRECSESIESSVQMGKMEHKDGKSHVNKALENDEDMKISQENGKAKHPLPEQLYMTPQEERDLEKEQSKLENAKKEKTKNSKLHDILTSFSAVYNCNKILSAKKNSSSLSCLNGIRVLSMLWIIWGHSNSFLVGLRLDNPKTMYETLYFTYRYNSTALGTYSVDSFFVLSGLLVTYLTLKELKARNGKINWFLYYFHRFWRLTPAYMITIAIWTSLTVHIGVGAGKEEIFREGQQICQDYWWTNLLYINNLHPFPGLQGGGCAGWSWYLANDMQFFVISPLFIVLLFNRKTTKLGIASVVAMCVSSIIVTTTLAGYYGLPIGKSGMHYNDRMESLEPWGIYTDIIYGKPWCRIQSYMVGVFTRYMLYRHMCIKKIKMRWSTNLLGWIFGVGIMYTLLYSLNGTSGEHSIPQWFASVWNGVCRTLFSMGVAWVAFACSIGHGGLINSFLSWGFWTPLARLTYGAYLLHPVVIILFLSTKKTMFHWTGPEIWYFTIANTVASYIAALGLSLLVESPTMGVQKVYLKKKK
ncbi:Nose resistant to fluoxetine protein 6 [Holothuria leucospilota]|uniref:Nose resistant to fluoxetine protein 6 n=1 Tax=Holothuria leucospilota TaxID=206669 RepID=A0A9Q0YMS0_HOLLE|nr:Nose resistant to fluoxetine protein 6 [Holothuria leucospilota]